MHWTTITALAFAAPSHALIRFGCSQLVTQRLDPLVQPGVNPGGHVHQIVGGNTFNATMDPATHDIPSMATCTSCQPSEDFSNYWTAVLYFKAQNGTYKRVQQKGNVFFEGQNGGMTVYYMQNQLADYNQQANVTAFKPGFRMFIGDMGATTETQADQFPQLTFTCLQTPDTRYPESKDFPTDACPAGIMANMRFKTCWDGVNLDSEDHMSHMSYPASGTFESQGPCPDTHPVRVPQVMYEVIWDTTPFNDKSLWPTDGSQPFVWSFGDTTGYGTHGDYVFGWKGDALQKIMDEPCYVNCTSMVTQSMDAMNACTMKPEVDEDTEGWLTALPGRA